MLQARIPRIAHYIKQYKPDWKVEVAVSEHKPSEKFYQASELKVRYFRNNWALLRYLKRFDTSQTVLHFFEPKATTGEKLHPYIKHAKVLFDFQDIYTTYYGVSSPIAWMQKQIHAENYILSHFDNVICHSLEVNYACREFRAKPKNRLFFLPYCDDRMNIPPKRNPNLGVVYAGGISAPSEGGKDSEITNLVPLARSLDEHGIRFNIFPSPNTRKQTCDRYTELLSGCPNFSLSAPVSQNKLIGELAGYSYGILPFFETKDWSSSPKMRLAISLKMFNFIEAGIPIIVSEDIAYQAWLIRRYNLGWTVGTMTEIGTLIEAIGPEEYAGKCASIEKNRPLFSLEKNCGRLIRFYQEIPEK